MKTAWKSFPAFSSTTDPTTGITYTDQYDVFTVGAGYVDVEAALTSTDVAKGTAMSPVATYNRSTNGSVYLTRQFTAVWNTSATWSNSAVWGSSQFVATLGAYSSSSTHQQHQRLVGQQCSVGQQRPVGIECTLG